MSKYSPNVVQYVLYCRDVKERDKCPCAEFHSGPVCKFTLHSWEMTHTLQAEMEDRWFWLLSPHCNRGYCVVCFEFRKLGCRMASAFFSSLTRKNGNFATFWYVGDVEQFSRRQPAELPKHGQNTGPCFGKMWSTIKDFLFWYQVHECHVMFEA